ncbi:Bug family tripartite tricarboxylate transporter substrate binding protein [Bordetella genomosp. 12]|uniref:ABC transporter substrate-binding protein n=1 Tax=Bordetella genomosp. 12 TaxID=463035 RepID=A0A261VB08_9BORD|nr:tripartite tricarboxylate transporter substrate binding protein [Bordetella genomosp. 12]OZI70951.1 hypothetical protein CAL22_13715 [Bordetella genomosp. 12]
MHRRTFNTALLTLPWIMSSARAGTHYPDRPIRLIVPYGAGTATDVLARQLSAGVQAEVGQPVIVENRPGASGMIGAELVARSAPDGQVLLVGTTQTHAIDPALYSKISYDPVADFAPVAGLADQDHVLVVGANFPAKSLAELVALAKSKPGGLSFASTGNGTPAHLVGEIFKREAGIDMMHVPYPGGAQALTDVMAGTVSLVFYPYQALKPHVDTGKMRALAVASSTRPAWLPDVPTTAELGYPNSVIAAWFGIYAPARTDPERVKKIGEVYRGILADPKLREQLAATGTTVRYQSPRELGAFTASEIERYGKLVQMSGAKVD